MFSLYQALYRKWRPRVFDDIYGQDNIVRILKRQCLTDRISHAYLFCGSRGTGKTTSAKILAKAVNCLNPKDGSPCGVCQNCVSIDNGTATDVLEMDAASNTGVDDVRVLRDEVLYPPSVMKKRVYIIDEVHMLTVNAFNALLKTLEEPPPYVVFILATTELNKIPETILSRCQRFDFKRIDDSVIAERLNYITEQEKIDIEPEATALIARLADGALRDAISLLESCVAGVGEKRITLEAVRSQLGIAGDDTVHALFEAVGAGDVRSALGVIDSVHYSSKDISSFIEDVIIFTRDLLIYKKIGESDGFRTFLSPESARKFKELSESLTAEQLLYYISVLDQTQTKISRYSLNKRTVTELAIIKLCDCRLSTEPEAVLARVSVLEQKLASLGTNATVLMQSGTADTANTAVKSTPAEKTKLEPEQPKTEPVKKTEPLQKPSSAPVAEPSSEPVSEPPAAKTAKTPEKAAAPTADGGEHEFEQTEEFFSELSEIDTIAFTYATGNRMTIKGNTVFLHVSGIFAALLEDDINLKTLSSALKRVCGDGYSIKIKSDNE